jgi:hypothetical protein
MTFKKTFLKNEGERWKCGRNREETWRTMLMFIHFLALK